MSKTRYLLLAMAAVTARPAAAQEVFAGASIHGVDTPISSDIGEDGLDFRLGYRFARLGALRFIGRPSPYVFVSLNSARDTDFAGVGLSWKLGDGWFFLRPGLGIVVHDGPGYKIGPIRHRRVDLGSRVLLEPEFAIGVRLNKRLELEASWLHLSHAHLFSEHNPGLDTVGLRLDYHLR